MHVKKLHKEEPLLEYKKDTQQEQWYGKHNLVPKL